MDQSVVPPPASTRPPALAELPRILAAAPHRMMFFAGAVAVLASMGWWALELSAGRWGWTWLPQPAVPAGWAHAMFAQYGMLAPFVFGFLLTVFPRWMNQPELTRAHYVPVFGGVFGGYVIAQAGLFGLRPLLVGGAVLMMSGWLIGLSHLFGVLRRHGFKDRWALSCFGALSVGACGLALFLAFMLGADPRLALAAIKLGTFGLLLPVYFTVAHRMVPFFSNNVVAGYRVVRPAWSLPLLWALLAAHLGFEFAQAQRWRFLADLPLALFFLGHWLAWQPWKARRPGLLAVLYLALAWLPAAFALFGADSLCALLRGASPLGRAPVHALTVGFFGSMLVAMVTRVTHGHSGRPLAMGPVPWFTFLAVQAVALGRIGAEFAADAPRAYALAASGWLLAFLPWALRAAYIYLTPRRDGRPG
ncbi:NnrS family protein [Mizugakiibacter sediminis]|uniref:NnrS family protein n=1 Tax=Mizugakiibacter sediminis TaxID=1475481 RepID=A0A0K8QL40_9GAMM|nr:NnrS family protein [Mizugakiibacter sediminis]GAP65603.1 NnrS family protein [Mizugakiibacter sediminis]